MFILPSTFVFKSQKASKINVNLKCSIIISTMNFIIIALTIALLWGIQPLIQKSLLLDFSSQSILIFSNVVFTFCLLIYSYFYRQVILEDFSKLGTDHCKLILFSAIICSFLTSITYYELIKLEK